MKLASFDAIVLALNTAGVRYLVVGGVAVNAHGYLRFTKDVDLVVRLATPDILGAFRALGALGYHPKAPVTAEQFADPEQRESWRREKGMLVLQMWSDAHIETPIDIFANEPFDFDAEYARALVGTAPDDPPARFASIPALIAMKRAAGRATDLIDIEKLREIERLKDT
jgi:hypothetical protein